MVYANEYNASDMSLIVIDGLGTIGVAVVGFATLVGLVLLFKWAKKKK